MAPIFTDDKGRPLPEKPTQGAGEDVGAFLERLYAWKQARTNLANEAFEKAFRDEMKRT